MENRCGESMLPCRVPFVTTNGIMYWTIYFHADPGQFWPNNYHDYRLTCNYVFSYSLVIVHTFCETQWRHSVKTRLYKNPPPYFIVLASSMKTKEVEVEFHRYRDVSIPSY